MIKLGEILNEMGLKLTPSGELDDTAPNADAIVKWAWNKDKSPVRTKHSMEVFAAYTLSKWSSSKYNEFSNDQLTAIRKAVKHPNSPGSKKIVDLYIGRSLHPFKHHMPVNSIQTIIPLVSGSDLNKRIAYALKTVCPNAEILGDATSKVTWGELEINQEMLDREAKGNDSIKYVKSYIDDKKKNHPNEPVQASKVKMNIRRYFKNFIKINPEKKKEVLEEYIRGKNVLIVDDTMEEGSTMESAYHVIDGFSPRDIMIYVFLFTDSSTKKKAHPPAGYQDHIKAQFDI